MSDPAALPSLDSTFGAVLIGNFLGATAFGILTVQTYFYFARFPNDPKWLRIMVAAVWVIDLVHSVATAVFSYQYTISYFAEPELLAFSTNIVSICLMLEPPTGFLVQLYFARRHWILNQSNRPLSAFLVFLAFIAFFFGEASGIATFHLKLFPEFLQYTYLAIVWLVGSALCDVLITFSIATALWKSKTGFRATDNFLSKLIVWTINTGLLTSVVAILDIITFEALDTALIHFVFNFLLAKNYSNTLLASLNRRRTVLEDRNHSVSGPVERIKLSKLRRKSSGGAYRTGGSVSVGEGVQIAVSTANYTDSTGRVIQISDSSELPTYLNDLTDGERKAHDLEPVLSRSPHHSTYDRVMV